MLGLPAPAWCAVLLVFAVPALLPFERAAELPIVIGAVFGVGALLRSRDLYNSASARTLAVALSAYVLAALLSAIDAFAPEKSWTTALGSLRLLAFAIGVQVLGDRALAAGISARRLSSWLAGAAALPIALWVADALVQAVTGWSIGGTLDADRLSGIFGADDLKLGPLLGALAPLLLWPLLSARRAWLALAWLSLLIVVLLAGARAGWVSFALVSAALAWRLAGGSWRRLAVWAAAATIVATLFAWVGYHSSESFHARVDRTLSAGDGNVDVALAGRLPIWTTAGRMALSHPINGVGVRSFRYAYPDYADAADPWVDAVHHTGAAHAHQIVLELLTETGSMGLALWLVAGWQLWRRSRSCAGDACAHAPWVALAVLTFPFNTHLAFYSSFLGIVLAWLLTLACLQARLREPTVALARLPS